MSDADLPVTFVVPGDLHLTEAGLDNHRAAAWMVREVNELIRPDFVQFIGDNVQDATEGQFRLFDELRARLEVPGFVLVGDHDVKDDPAAERFRAHNGDTYGSTTLRGFRFLRLDTQQHRPLGLSTPQVDWFRSEVDAAIAAGQRVVVFQHNYPFQVWESFDGPGVDGWREVVQGRRIAAIVCGHTHYLQLANDGRNAVVAVRSIGDPEGGPPGYLVGVVVGDDFAITYRSAGEEGPVALITHPRESILATAASQVVRGLDFLRARAWSIRPIARVEGRIDDGDWFPLGPAGGGFFEAPLPGDRLDKGEHTAEVALIDADDRRAGHRIEFPVDPTGRYTAVPSVRPRVTRTDFC